LQREINSKLSLKQRAAAARLKALSPLRPTLALILGSTFQGVANRLKIDAVVDYGRLPGFPSVGVCGHVGKVLIGYLSSTPVMVLSGRAHFYEGHSMDLVTSPVRVLALYGIRDLLLTNAAGAVNRRFKPGDFMILRDHINLMGINPLRGARGQMRECFVDMTGAYDLKLSRLLRRAGQASGVRLHSGVYLAVCGPSYETPAEIRAFARLGADAVGMSTVPETIIARQCGLNVAGLSCLTNLASGLCRFPLSHDAVLSMGTRVGGSAAQIIDHFAVLYGQSHPPTPRIRFRQNS
jgi:purine-nucleoside phosphorylase